MATGWGREFFWGEEEVLKPERGDCTTPVNALNATELCTLKLLIVGYVNFSSAFFKVVLFNVVIIYEPEGGRGVCRGYMNPGEHRMCAYTRRYILLICVSKLYH